jgi:hypothetical protein
MKFCKQGSNEELIEDEEGEQSNVDIDEEADKTEESAL